MPFLPGMNFYCISLAERDGQERLWVAYNRRLTANQRSCSMACCTEINRTKCWVFYRRCIAWNCHDTNRKKIKPQEYCISLYNATEQQSPCVQVRCSCDLNIFCIKHLDALSEVHLRLPLISLSSHSSSRVFFSLSARIIHGGNE